MVCRGRRSKRLVGKARASLQEEEEEVADLPFAVITKKIMCGAEGDDGGG